MTFNQRHEAVKIVGKILEKSVEPYLYETDIPEVRDSIRQIVFQILKQIRNEFNVFVMIPEIVFTQTEDGWKLWFKYDGAEISLFQWISMLDGE